MMEHAGSSGNASDFYISSGTQTLLAKVSVVAFSRSTKIQENYLKVGHYRLLSNPFPFIIH
jgi:hypothetical protein